MLAKESQIIKSDSRIQLQKSQLYGDFTITRLCVETKGVLMGILKTKKKYTIYVEKAYRIKHLWYPTDKSKGERGKSHNTDTSILQHQQPKNITNKLFLSTV